MTKYEPVQASSPRSSTDDPAESCEQKPFLAVESRRTHHALGITLALSIITNTILTTTIVHSSSNSGSYVEERTRFGRYTACEVMIINANSHLSTGLTRTISQQWQLFYDFNETTWNETWENSSYDFGIIAFKDTYAKSMGLPRSQGWPWDVSRGIYVINAYHNLHCVDVHRPATVFYALVLPYPLSFTETHSCGTRMIN